MIDTLIVFGWIALYGLVGSGVGAIGYCSVRDHGGGASQTDGTPVMVMVIGSLLWPAAFIPILGYWLAHRNQPAYDRYGRSVDSALTKKQRAKLEFEERLLELEKSRNDEMERANKIILAQVKGLKSNA